MTGKGTIGQITVKSDHDVEWKIANFFSFTRENGFYYFSPFFTLSKHQWYFQIYPNGQAGHEGWMSWYLFTAGSTIRGPGATFYFGIKKSDEKIHRMGPNKSWIFGERGPGFGYPAFLNISELAGQKSELAPLNTLTLTFSLWGYDDFDSTAKTSSLSNNLLEMFTSQKWCDVTLQVKMATFSVHRLILMARSTVFEAMFEAPMTERGTGVVKIDDCDPDAFWHFLVYLYSGRLEKLSRHMFELYKIADKYNVQDLKSDCLIALMGNLSVENFFDVVNLAATFSEYSLQMKAEHFFSKNYAEIFHTRKWESFMKEEQELANSLLISMADHLKR